jgi:hypothetical protein
MTIINVTDEVKILLKETKFSPDFIDIFMNSDFLIMQKENDSIIGAGFIGGMFHSYGLEILEEYRGKGLGKKILYETVEECKKRNFSVITGVWKQTNLAPIGMHMKIGFVPVFNLHYNEKEGREIIVIMPLNKKGQLFVKLCKIFDSKLGNLIFAIFFKLMTPFLKSLIAFSGDTISPISISSCFKNYISTKIVLETKVPNQKKS